jgi:uncharacterized Zn finger protein (UPF0148 family)
MTITTCPHCQMRVIPRPDGTCPSCNGLIGQTESPPSAPRASTTVIKRTAKTASRRQSESKGGKASRSTPPAPPSAKEIEPLFQEYLQITKDVRKGAQRVFYPYLALGIAVPAVCIAVSFLTWQEKLVGFALKPQPVPLTWVLIWGGIAAGLGVIVLGAVKGDRWGLAQAREIAKDRAGFPEFYKAFLKRTWPKAGLPVGPAFDKLLKILGKK